MCNQTDYLLLLFPTYLLVLLHLRPQFEGSTQGWFLGRDSRLLFLVHRLRNQLRRVAVQFHRPPHFFQWNTSEER